MQIEKKPLEDASDAELRTFATDFMQLEIAQSATRTQMLAQLSKVWKQPFINVAAEAQAAQTGEVKPEVVRKDLTPRYQDDPVVLCKIGTTSYPGGEEPAAPNVNGIQLVVPRQVPLRLPYRVYLALKDSYEDFTRPDANGHPVTTRTTNFPFEEVTLPPQAEIDAWFARTKDKVLG